MRSDLPSGTVTFLFTDVEGSTRLLHELGEAAYADALTEHRRVIREACTAEGGVEVDTQGDAFFFAFPTAPGALAAAGALTERLAAEGPIQVRVGLHTGTPLLSEEGYVGHDLHRAARIAAAGHGGQVILSGVTASLIDLELTDLGEHRLKDIAEPVPVFQLGAERFPPLKTISNTNLPRPTSSFLGREAELAEVVSRMEQRARLVTLTGPGGTGKTRLALEAASTLVPSYKAGVFWVGLASLRDPALVTGTIAQTLGAKDELAKHIADREMLLLLDNLEQVIEAAPELGSLLAACPNLTLLVTSRELLRIQGEVEYPVPPLASTEAVELFCARSQLEQSEEIAELCLRLDSLPLAVELAAARTKALTVSQILERLSGRLDLLKGGRDSDPRQQTLRATIEWSYDLLTTQEQELFAALSVFAGGCTLEAAEEVCDASLDTLQSLVEKSLLRFTPSESGGRYWMLETIREYAGERLEARGQDATVRQRHAEHLARSVAALREGILGAESSKWLTLMDDERGNVRAALGWLERSGQSEAQLDLVTLIWLYWDLRGAWREGQRWVAAPLMQGSRDRGSRRAKALRVAAIFALPLGELDRATSYAEESLSIQRELADRDGILHALSLLGRIAAEQGEYDRAEQLYEEAAELGADDVGIRAVAATSLADLAMRQGNFTRGIALSRESLRLYRELERDVGISVALYNIAYCLYRDGEDAEALSSATKSLVTARRTGDVELTIWILMLLGSLEVRRGNIAEAARLVGAADAECRNLGLVLTGAEGELRDSAVDEIRQRLGNEAYEDATARAHAFSFDEAVAFALASSEHAVAGVAPSQRSTAD